MLRNVAVTHRKRSTWSPGGVGDPRGSRDSRLPSGLAETCRHLARGIATPLGGGGPATRRERFGEKRQRLRKGKCAIGPWGFRRVVREVLDAFIERIETMIIDNYFVFDGNRDHGHRES